MIKIHQVQIPSILQKNQHSWTVNLLHCIKEYQGYSQIPENVKNIIVNKYREHEIKEAVKETTNGKCSFCESIIETVDYINIEHFYPKSLFPKYAFKWSNLIPSCRKCNIPKDNFDTKNNPFVNPTKDNPEELFYYKDLKIKAIDDNIKAINTNKVCDLNRLDLIRQRSEILINFYSTEESINEYNQHYNSLVQPAAKLRVASNLLNSIENLNEVGGYYKSYAGFFRYLVSNSAIIKTSIDIINSHSVDLQINNGFKFDW